VNKTAHAMHASALGHDRLAAGQGCGLCVSAFR
jgi:hypothetical protein